ncbi:hypothetical protein GIB67_006547, partial [Kingdonia uniflora]
ISTQMKELQFLLSQFSYKPKPIFEGMSIQTNVPALAMEEIAPVVVSDAAMLALEEVFAGKGDIKEEVKLTREQRKQMRANKKRKFKDSMSGTFSILWRSHKRDWERFPSFSWHFMF